MASTPSRLDAVINLAKRRGFVFPCGEIYGGTRSAWDYGPLGVELKENIKRQWWQYMVRSRDDVVGLDSSVILPRETWVASGHVGAFTDPLVESLHTHKRYRADQLIEDYAALETEAETSPFNSYTDGKDRTTGIIACGIAWNYLMENCPDGCPHPVLKVSQYPLPGALVRRMAAECGSLLVIEEGQPFVEEAIRGILPTPVAVRGRLTDDLIGQNLSLTRGGGLHGDLHRHCLRRPRRRHRGGQLLRGDIQLEGLDHALGDRLRGEDRNGGLGLQVGELCRVVVGLRVQPRIPAHLHV